MRAVGTALRQYAAANGERFPPFAFHDTSANLALSGHWGGPEPGVPGPFAARGALPAFRAIRTVRALRAFHALRAIRTL